MSKSIWVSVFAGAMLFMSGCALAEETPLSEEAAVRVSSSGLEMSKACRETAKGKWLDLYQECETGDKNWCEAEGGTFKECESRCRHNPEARFCVAMCVSVCELK